MLISSCPAKMTAAKLRHFGPLLLLGLAATARLGAAPDPVDTLQRASADWIKTRTETVRLAGGAGKTGQVLRACCPNRAGD